MKVETRVSEGIIGPAKWAAVGALAAVAVMGLVGAIVLRQPKELSAAQPPSATPTHAFAAPVATQPPPIETPQNLTQRREPQPEPPTSKSTIESKPSPQAEPKPEPASTPPPAPPSDAPALPTPPPTPPAPKPAQVIVPKPLAPVGKININKATQAELDLLPNIGPAIAARIIEYRNTHGPFKRIDDLDNVKGIGPKTLERLRPLITVD